MENAGDDDSHMDDAQYITDEDEILFFDKAREYYFAKKNLISHQLDSYNHFLTKDMASVFEGAPSITIKPSQDKVPATQADGQVQSANISFGCITMHKPDWTDQKGNVIDLYPTEARLRKMTYSASIYADINVKIFVTQINTDDLEGSNIYWKRKKSKGERTHYTTMIEGDNVFEREETLKKAFVGRLPVMVMSDACHLSTFKKESLIEKDHCLLDDGGYFIINGSEKVMISQERIAHRLICTSMGKNKGFRCTYRSSAMNESTDFSYTTARVIFSNPKCMVPLLTVYFYGLKNDVPVVILFRALGVANDKELVDRICEDSNDLEMMDLLRYSFYQADKEMRMLSNQGRENLSLGQSTSKEVAMCCLQKNVPTEVSVQDTLDKFLFPHLQQVNNHKIMLLGYILHCLLACLLGRRKLDNLDEFRNKRIELPGDLLKKKMTSLLHQYQRDVQRKLEKSFTHADSFMHQLQVHLDGSILTNGLQRAFATGNWDARRAGVVATLERRNPLYTLSHLRQIRISLPPVFKQDRNLYMNKYAVGRVCMVETPDNENCGIVHTLATGCDISLGSSAIPVLEIISHLCPQDMMQLPSSAMSHFCKVFVNGDWVAIHDNPEHLVGCLRNLRRQSHLHKQVEIATNLHRKEIQVFCDSGRFLRPLILLEKNRPSISMSHFKGLLLSGRLSLDPGVMEAMGPEEEESCHIAEDYKELQIARIEAGGQNFSHCQLDPCFSFSLGSSLIPFFNRNGFYRVMLQAQKHGKQALGIYTSCMRARSDTTSHLLFYPQRPLAETKISKLSNTYHLSNGQNVIVAICPFWGYNQEDAIVINQSSVDRGLFRSYHLRSFDFDMRVKNEQSAPKPSYVMERRTQSNLDEDGLPHVGENFLPLDVLAMKVGLQESTSTLRLNAVDRGRVDQVIVASDDEENPIARIRLREMRAPVDGDKFSSRHGQKGVIGLLCPQEDMFFTNNGIIPDIIINPHAFPSRQSIGQLAEGVIAKIAAVSGRQVDASPFNGLDSQTMLNELKSLGYGDGKEVLKNGRTGELLKNKVTMNPIFYQRLVHMAMDKLKCRSRGSVDPYTRQPVSGRKRQGGVKFGEMERDCLIAHGALANLHERLFLLSDPYTVYVCNSCNILVWKGKQGLVCSSCKTRANIVRVHMPYGCKLLYQELFSMGIRLKFWTKAY